MKRFIGVLAVAAFVFSPMTAFAATLASGELYSLPSEKAVIGNLYVAASTATVGGRVTGDLFVVGGTVTVAGSVGGDIAAGGGTVQVLGAVDGDVRVVGGSLSVNQRVGGDLVMLGGTVHVLPGATIAGDVIVAGGQMIIDGVVSGSVRVAGGALFVNGTVRGAISAKINEKVEIGSGAVIGGTLSYHAPTEAIVAQGARLGGGVDYTPSTKVMVGQQTPQRAMRALVSVLTGLKLLMMLGLAALMVWRWRRTTVEVLAVTRDAFWPSLGRGLAFLILVPIASVLLLISFIGTLPGVLLILCYIAAMILAKTLAGILVGSVIVMIAKKQQVLHVTWGSALGGVIALSLLGMIPVLGWLLTAVATLTAFGAIAHRMQESVARS